MQSTKLITPYIYLRFLHCEKAALIFFGLKQKFIDFSYTGKIIDSKFLEFLAKISTFILGILEFPRFQLTLIFILL